MLINEPIIGHSVNVATGSMTFNAIDFSINGKVNLVWHRLFSSLSTNELSPLGYGWHSPFFSSLKWDAELSEYVFFAPNGALVSFPTESQDNREKIVNFGAFSELVFSKNQIIICQWDVDTQKASYYWYEQLLSGKISQLKKITDATQQGVELNYDKEGRLNGIRQILEKRTFLLQYNESNLISRIDFLTKKNTNIPQIYYEYDHNNRLVKEIDINGGSRAFEYDKNNLITAIQYKNNGYYEFIYDDDNYCIYSGTKEGFGSKKFTYFPLVGKSEVRDSKGNVTSYQCNENGQIIEEISAVGGMKKTDFDKFGRIVNEIDALQNITRYAYDTYGNRSIIQDALGNKQLLKFNKYHQVSHFTDAKGNNWERTYNNHNQLASVITPLNERYLFRYDNFGNLTQIRNPAGAKVTQQFSAKGILQSNTDWEGHVTSYKYDSIGNLIALTDALGYKTDYQYDLQGQIQKISYSDGTTETYHYDHAGNVLIYKDKRDEVTEYRYGACNRLLEKTDAIGRKTLFKWSTELEQLDKIINPIGEEYKFEYDVLGQINKEISFDGRELCYEYDLAGNRTATINGMGERIEYQHDKLGRVIKQNVEDGTGSSFSYDELGHLVTASNTNSQLSFQRDILGRILQEKQNGHIITRSYNSTGDLNTLELDDTLSLKYQFDHDGLVSEIELNKHLPIQIQRDARGSEVSRTLGENLQLNQAFDTMGRVIQQQVSDKYSPKNANTRIKRQYQYTNAVLVGIQDDTRGKTTYQYDPVERITQSLRDKGVSENFHYDDNDNIVKVEQDDVISQREYDKGNHITRNADFHYDYDKQGRLIKKTLTNQQQGEEQAWKYEWDTLDQLKKFTNPEGESWQYEYDPFGRRTCKLAPDGTKHQFIWDEDVVLQEWSGEQSPINWIFDPHSFAPLAKEEDSKLYSIINDHLGTPHEMLDQDGRLVWQVGYHSWGEVNQQFYNEVDCPVRFQGQWYDQESGLCYNRFRYYDAATGKYITDDPIGIHGGLNLSAYVVNPNKFLDPVGLCDTTVFPKTADEMSVLIGPPKKVGVTPDGTIRTTWMPNSNTKIRHESHPHGLEPGDVGFNPRHHGEHFHVETKPNNLSWNQAKKQGKILKSKPEGYTLGSGTGFLSGETFPGN